MTEGNGRHGSPDWERRRDAEQQAKWRSGVDGKLASLAEWRVTISDDVKNIAGLQQEIRQDQRDRATARATRIGMFVFARNICLGLIALAGAIGVVWPAFVALIRSAIGG